MFDVDVRLGCDLLWKVDACFCFAVLVDACFLHFMLGYYVVSYVKVVCVCVLPLLFMICVWI